MGLELAERLGWKVPDVIFYSTGGGTELIGMWKAWHTDDDNRMGEAGKLAAELGLSEQFDDVCDL